MNCAITKMETKEKALLLSALALVIVLRLPSLADPKYYLDEGVYASVAYELGQGGTLYQTAWDLKPPGIFLVYLLFQKLFGPQALLAQRIFNTVLAALVVFGVFKLAVILDLYERGSSKPFVTAFSAAIFLGLPFFETQIFNTENIFIVTSLFAFIFGLKFKGGWQEPFIAGALFGVGQWLKIHPLFDLAAFGIFALYKFKFNKKFWLPFVAGFATPLLALLSYLTANGILADFIETNFSYNLFYVEELPQIKFFGNLLVRTLLLLGTTATLVLLKFKNKISEQSFLLLLWFVFVFYGALLSARAYGHYFIPILVPTALLIGLGSDPHRGSDPRKTFVTTVLVLLPFVGYVSFKTPINIETFRQEIFSNQIYFYQHRLSYLTGRMDKREFEKDFTPKPWRLRELKAYLDENVSKNEDVYPAPFCAGKRCGVYIWGISPWANYVLERRPAQKYLMWFHVLGVGNREEEVYQDLLTKLPEVIIVEDNQPEGETYEISRPPFFKLQLLIDTNYRFETTIAGYNIYRRSSLALQ